ncbi:MAG: GNAT family N-acetyltransferase [Ignavibacterium sp.]
MKFVIQDNLDDTRILNFILEDERASIYHHPAWLKAISSALNFQPKYFLIFNGETLTGLIPFTLIKDTFYSLPFTTHCDPIIPENITLKQVVGEINRLVPGIQKVRMKFRECEHLLLDGLDTINNYYNHVVYLDDDLEKVYNSLGRRSIRRFINKSYSNNLKIRFGDSENDLRIFYSLECKLRKSLGLPPAPFKFFLCLWNNLFNKNLLMLPIIEKDSLPIASSVILRFRNKLYFEYTAIDKKYIDLYPNHFLHWEVIKKNHSEFGVRIVDLGRTDKNQTGLIFFKENWNAQRIKLLEYNKNSNKNLKHSKLFNTFRIINKHLPIGLLKVEGKILFNHFDC